MLSVGHHTQLVGRGYGWAGEQQLCRVEGDNMEEQELVPWPMSPIKFQKLKLYGHGLELFEELRGKSDVFHSGKMDPVLELQADLAFT